MFEIKYRIIKCESISGKGDITNVVYQIQYKAIWTLGMWFYDKSDFGGMTLEFSTLGEAQKYIGVERTTRTVIEC